MRIHSIGQRDVLKDFNKREWPELMWFQKITLFERQKHLFARMIQGSSGSMGAKTVSVVAGSAARAPSGGEHGLLHVTLTASWSSALSPPPEHHQLFPRALLGRAEHIVPAELEAQWKMEHVCLKVL
jgi:hypothetical protein